MATAFPAAAKALSKLSDNAQPPDKSLTATLKLQAADTGAVKEGLIAIVDDDPRIRALLRDELEDLGYSCVECNGMKALLTALDQPIQLIFLDLQMPDGDGLQCLQQLNQLAYQGPVLMFSGLDDPQLKAQAMAAGACGWVLKSALFDQLPELLQQHLQS